MRLIRIQTTQRRALKNLTTQSHSNYRMAKYNRYAAYSHPSKDLKYDLASLQKNPIEPDQWTSRCSSIRTDPSR